MTTEGVVGWRFACWPCHRDHSGSRCSSSIDDAGFVCADRRVQSSRVMGVSGHVGRRAVTARPMGSVTLMQFNMGRSGTVFGLLRKPPAGATARAYVSMLGLVLCRSVRLVISVISLSGHLCNILVSLNLGSLHYVLLAF